MLYQSLCKTFICSLLLINCFVGALVIMNPASERCLIDFAFINARLPFVTANVGFLDCDKVFFDDTSWTSLPAPNGTFNICIKDTQKCLGLTYDKEEAAFRITLMNKSTGSVMQRWKLDGEKLTNFYWAPLNLCAEDKGGLDGVFLKGQALRKD